MGLECDVADRFKLAENNSNFAAVNFGFHQTRKLGKKQRKWNAISIRIFMEIFRTFSQPLTNTI